MCFLVLCMHSFVSVVSNLKTLAFSLSTERERLKTAIESEVQVPSSVSNQSIINLKNNLNQVLQQNAELRSRLVRIQEASDFSDLSLLDHLGESVSVHLLLLLLFLFWFVIGITNIDYLFC